jgi:hypothetical protein
MRDQDVIDFFGDMTILALSSACSLSRLMTATLYPNAAVAYAQRLDQSIGSIICISTLLQPWESCT